jgi:hypothetical protein
MALGDEHFEEYIRSRTDQPPKTLYKYTTADTACKILTARKLRYQSPLNYNDPYDSQWDLFWFVWTPEYAEKERAILNRALRDTSTWPSEMDRRVRAAMAKEVARINALATESDRERERNLLLDACTKHPGPSSELKNRVLNQLQRMRVLCLCESDASMLMWSHYTEQHRGVVLGFDSGVYERKHRRPLEKVRYSLQLPMLFDAEEWARSIIFGLPQQMLEDYIQLVLTKSQSWEYEREWRFVQLAPEGTDGMSQDVGFPPESLVEVIFGCRTDPSVMKKLTELARAIHSKVHVASMSTHPGRFELVKQPIDGDTSSTK